MLSSGESHWVCAMCSIKVRKNDGTNGRTYRRTDCCIMLSAGFSQRNKWRWWVWTEAVYWQIDSPSQLACSEGWQPPGDESAFIKWAAWTIAVAMEWWDHHKHLLCSVLFLAALEHRVGHTMDVLFPFISVLCHSDWLFHGESCPRIDVVHPGHTWSSSPPVHLALFLALSLSPGNFLVSSWCDHSMLTSLLSQCLTVPLYSSFVKNPLICFLCCPWIPQNLSQPFHLKGVKDVFLHSFWVSSFHSRTLLQATLALSLVVSSLSNKYAGNPYSDFVLLV